jgi:hypothetical protein
VSYQCAGADLKRSKDLTDQIAREPRLESPNFVRVAGLFRFLEVMVGLLGSIDAIDIDLYDSRLFSNP